MTQSGTIGALVALMLLSAGCGSAQRSSRGTTHANTGLKPALTGAGEDLTNGVRGGTLTVYAHTDFLSLDPGQAYDAVGYQVIYSTQRPLFSYRPNQTETPSPDLADGSASITDGGRTVTVHIRPGVHYSPPVNREVTSADVAYAIERGANPNVANPYFPTYFDNIVGARKATGGPIQGIATPDKRTIVFHLIGPYGSLFAAALSLPLSAPVPKEFAAPLDRHKPTQYGSTYEVATGPYMLKSDSKGKFLGIGYQPGKSATLVRNPNWSASTDARPAYLDRIDINIGGDPNVIGRQVLTGSHAVQSDTPARSIVKLAYERYYDQLVATPGAGNNYVALNNKLGPFSNLNVRRALWAALDREAMIKANGGAVVAQLGTHFIYPGSEGYDQAGGVRGPAVDYNEHPSGDPAVAAKYMKLAGYAGGTYTGRTVIKIVGSTGDPYPDTAAVVNQALQSLGFKTNFNLVDPSVMYSKFCGVPAREIDVCPNVGWIRDFADSQTILDPAFNGASIVSTDNPNWGQVDDPQINAAMKAAEQVVGASARAEAWAHIDRMLVDDAAAIPWAFVNQPTIRARDVRGINDLWNLGSWDYAYSSLR